MKSVNAASELAAQMGKSGVAEIKIADFDFDLDKDGKIDAFEQKVKNALMAADTDGSGTLTPAEFVSVLKDMAEGEKKRAGLAKQVTGLSLLATFLLVILSVVSILGAVVGGESIKESHVSGANSVTPSVMTDTSGATLGIAAATQEHGMWDLPTLSIPVLSEFKALQLYIDMTTSAEVAGWTVASTRPTTMYKKAANQLVMVTAEGFKINIDSTTKTGTILMDGATYPISDEPPPESSDSTRRQLTELLDPPNAAKPTRRRRLRRGGLSTQGRFNMAAGSNDNLTGDGR